MNRLRVLVAMGCVSAWVAMAAPEVGKTLPAVRLEGDDGGLVTGQAWTSDSMRGKMRVLFYVDPDEKELNEHVGQAIQKANLDKDFYGSVAVINMGATWLPNFAIARSLKAKQEEYPRTVYVKDINKTLIKRWGLGDDGYDVVVLDPAGTVLFYGTGALTKAQTETVVRLLSEGVAAAKAKAAK